MFFRSLTAFILKKGCPLFNHLCIYFTGVQDVLQYSVVLYRIRGIVLELCHFAPGPRTMIWWRWKLIGLISCSFDKEFVKDCFPYISPEYLINRGEHNTTEMKEG
jgi:hypothetical protein